MVIEEFLDDPVSSSRVVVHINSVASVRLNIGFECACRWERHGDIGGDRRQSWVAGGGAVSTTEDGIFICLMLAKYTQPNK